MPCCAWRVGRGRDARGGGHNAGAAAGTVRGVVASSMIDSEVTLAWSLEGGKVGAGGRSFFVFTSFLWWPSGSQR